VIKPSISGCRRNDILPVYICSTILLSKKSCKGTTFLREMQVLERETNEKTKNEAKKQDKMKKQGEMKAKNKNLPSFEAWEAR